MLAFFHNKHILFCFLLVFITGNTKGQIHASNRNNAVPTLTLTYDITITARKNNSIAEMYNGGTQTIFINNDNARLRMVSLMRIQSIFHKRDKNTRTSTTTIVKESGKDRYKIPLNEEQWLWYNRNYEQTQYDFIPDTVNILGYSCKKVIIRRSDGEEITAFYTDQLRNNILPKIMPVFGGIPGLVLKYEHGTERNKITYTANELSFKEIDANAFKIPAKGYVTKRFTYQKNSESAIPEVVLNDEDDDEENEEP